MFDPEFYPTPKSVIDLMGIDCYDRVVLEPSAGKGDIVDYCAGSGASLVLACEKHPDLRKILQTKCDVVGDDFFKVNSEDISHVDLIVMNPPFSNADKHIIHAYKIAPEGCEIIALCNYETINNQRGWGRSELNGLIADYGEGHNLGDCFSSAERKTGVNIGMVRLFKPRVSNDSTFDDFYLTGDETSEHDSIVSFNEIKAVVNTYLAAVKCFEKVEIVANELQAYTNVTFTGKQLANGTYEKHELKFGDRLSFNAGYDDKAIVSKEGFAKAYQKKCWSFIFNRVGIEKYVTKGVMNDINKFIEGRKNYPFSVKNISRMLDIIIGTRENTMSKAIVEAIDCFTRNTHENRYGVEGWKTNKGHLLNHKFIIDGIAETSYGGTIGLRNYGYRFDMLNDLIKSLCFVVGVDYSFIPSINDAKKLQTNTWYDWGFFQFKVFKKGTGHFKFKNEDDWAKLNQAYAKIKGMTLPEKLKNK